MHAEPILKEFEKKTGIRVKTVFDSEAVKSVGLVNRLRAESKNPQADVFWNNEMARTMQLQQEKVVGRTRHFAARVRVLVYNTDLVKAEEAPRSIFDLADPKWRGKVAMAYPLFGTTATHAAALFEVLGEEKAKSYYQALKDNDVRVFEGNSVACEQVARGHCLIGITDTDDFWERKSKGLPIEMVYPDQAPSPSTLNPQPSTPLGCCVIPNTVSLVRGRKDQTIAVRLLEYLCSRETEEKLAFGPSRQIPMMGNDIPVPPGVKKLSELKPMKVEDDGVAEALPSVTEFLQKLFAR
jgi:iron(III) transport system substrate-binding protein